MLKSIFLDTDFLFSLQGWKKETENQQDDLCHLTNSQKEHRPTFMSGVRFPANTSNTNKRYSLSYSYLWNLQP